MSLEDTPRTSPHYDSKTACMRKDDDNHQSSRADRSVLILPFSLFGPASKYPQRGRRAPPPQALLLLTPAPPVLSPPDICTQASPPQQTLRRQVLAQQPSLHRAVRQEGRQIARSPPCVPLGSEATAGEAGSSPVKRLIRGLSSSAEFVAVVVAVVGGGCVDVDADVDATSEPSSPFCNMIFQGG